MLMVICGAGASSDSAGFDPGSIVRNWQPPMGAELFANRDYYGPHIDRYQEVRALVHRYRGIPNSVALESDLETLTDASTGRQLLRKQLMALRYYLQKVITESTREWSNRIHGVTNYVRLVDDIDRIWTDVRKETVCYVTFNYDTMLDGALGHIGIKVWQSMDHYIQQPNYLLIKPHGSVNWFHPVTGLIRNLHPYMRQIIDGIDSVKIDPMFVLLNEHNDIDDFEAVPALSMPIAKKTQFEMPQSHLDAVKAVIPQVTHLLVIGWRGNEEHFRALLDGLDRKHLISLVVSRDSSSAIQIARTLNLPDEKPAISDGGFTPLLRGTELTEFLQRT
jgi:hypothetical protein